MRTKIFIDTDHGSWDSAGGNMAVGLGFHVQLGHAAWTSKRSYSTRLTESCMKTFPILSASRVPGAKSC